MKVPEERLPDFYSMYGHWLEAPNTTAADTGSTADGESLDWNSADVHLAKAVWDKFSETAKALFSALINEPSCEFSGDELARLLNIRNGRHGVAGVLAWPGRRCIEVGRTYCWNWKYPDGETAVYWMNPELADLFRQARDR